MSTNKWSASKRQSACNKTKGRCWYCGKLCEDETDITIDHKIAQRNGGTDDLSNLVLACKKCNSSKRHKSIEEFRRHVQLKNTQLPVSFTWEQIEFLRLNFGFQLPLADPPIFYGETLEDEL